MKVWQNTHVVYRFHMNLENLILRLNDKIIKENELETLINTYTRPVPVNHSVVEMVNNMPHE